MRGRHEFAQVLTARTDLSVKFDERWQVSRIAVAILFPVLASTAIGVSYSIAANGPPTAFTIAGTFLPRCTWTVVADLLWYIIRLRDVGLLGLPRPGRTARLRGLVSLYSLPRIVSLLFHTRTAVNITHTIA